MSYETNSLLSLQADNNNQAPVIVSTSLATFPATKYEVVNSIPHYRQYITYENARLSILTPNFKSEGLTRKLNGSNFSILVPVETWLRTQLNVIEDFVKQNVNVGNHIMAPVNGLKYKPLWLGQRMFIRVAHWCNILKRNEIGEFESVKHDTPLGPGTYNMTIEVPYIYIGPHKRGEDFSLALNIVQIVFQPDTERSVLIQREDSKPTGGQFNHVPCLQEVKA